ncbi:hypothetical protein [Xanthomonas translucens]|uniref:hypothetical protein n=1 Tax=Xanthomonas campestris pv. translucens TaxID=343 RepID=UPI0012D8CF3F|nr:hypothetical protein [Xanthomonas translucens]
MKNDFLEILESRLHDGTGVYVNEGVDSSSYFRDLAEDVRRNKCEPSEITAVVMPPGLLGFPEGTEISGFCVAHHAGRWLVYRPEDDLFYAFWGASKNNLGAHGVFGNPLYCWSA